MAAIINSGRAKIAQKQGAGQVLNIVKFVFANIAGINESTPIDLDQAMPVAGNIVHETPVAASGYITPDQVAYSAILSPDVGNFNFNWVGLVDDENTLIAVTYTPEQYKYKTVGLTVGNTITRNFLTKYNNAQTVAAINVPVEAWQIDFMARLKDAEEHLRQDMADFFGSNFFIGQGFQIVAAGAVVSAKAGSGFVSGLRVALAADQVIDVGVVPKDIWLDVHLSQNASSAEVVFQFRTTAVGGTLSDYTDTANAVHYVEKIASVSAGYAVTDYRRTVNATNGILEDLLNRINAKANAAHSHQWNEIQNKPETFPAAAHGHPWSEISNKPTTFPAAVHGHSWDEISNKPNVWHTGNLSPVTTNTNQDIDGTKTFLGQMWLKSEIPVIHMQDINSPVATMAAFTSYKDNTGYQVGWIGYGSENGEYGIHNGNRNIRLYSPTVFDTSVKVPTLHWTTNDDQSASTAYVQAQKTSSPTDHTPGKTLNVGDFGVGRYLDLRGTIYETGAPSAVFGKGFVTGMAVGSALGVGGGLGVLEVHAHWPDQAGAPSVMRKFTQGHSQFSQYALDANTWSNWSKAWTNADYAEAVTVNTSQAILGAKTFKNVHSVDYDSGATISYIYGATGAGLGAATYYSRNSVVKAAVGTHSIIAGDNLDHATLWSSSEVHLMPAGSVNNTAILDTSGNFKVAGSLYEGGTTLSAKYLAAITNTNRLSLTVTPYDVLNGGTFYYWVVGKLVYFSCQFTFDHGSNEEQFATLPTAIRPQWDTVIPIYIDPVAAAQQTRCVQVRVLSNGPITAYINMNNALVNTVSGTGFWRIA